MKEGFLKAHSRGVFALTWLTDLVTVISAFFVSGLVLGLLEFSNDSIRWEVLGLATLLAATYFPASAFYRTRRGESLLLELRLVFIAVGAVFVSMALFNLLFKDASSFDRNWFLLWWFFSFLALCFYRIAGRALLRSLRSSGFNRRFVIVVGDPGMCEPVQRSLEEAQWAGFEVLRVFEGKVQDVWPDVQAFLDRNHVDQVWLTMPLRSEHHLRRIADRLSRYVVDVKYVPDTAGMVLLGRSVSFVAGMPVLNLSDTPIDGFNRFLKEVEDRVLAMLFLLILAPLMLIIAAGVKISSPGPVLYRQERLGVNSRSIRMFKFRSMPVNAESKSGPVWNKKGEVRATPFGHFLRSTSLDELPQLFNVLFGDMSIVGPRPERPMFVEQFKDEIPGYMQKHRVKAGITGWAQINGWRGDTDLNKRIEHDLYYIQHWSLLFDFKIIFLTITRGLIHKNAG